MKKAFALPAAILALLAALTLTGCERQYVEYDDDDDDDRRTSQNFERDDDRFEDEDDD